MIAKEVSGHDPTNERHIDTETLFRATRERLGPLFEQLRQVLLSQAQEAGCLDRMWNAVDRFEAAVKTFQYWAVGHFLELCRVVNETGKNPFLTAQAELTRSIDRLDSFKALLKDGGVSCPKLTRRQRQIYDLLALQRLTACEIGRALGMSANAVAKHIGRMRADGFDIHNDRGGTGYYRTDIPPVG